MNTKAEIKINLFETLYRVFVRALALCLLYFAIQYWLRLIGYFDGPEYQFDTMSLHWQIACAVLAVVHPVAALGLWGLFSWGLVVWLFSAVVEIAMYTYFTELFGENRELIMFHAGCAAFIAIFLIVDRIITNKR